LESKKLVLFGAGKIGRSFIGQLFGRSGFEVVFVDIDDRIISELNRCKRYQVIIKSANGDEVIWVENVRGVNGSDVDTVASEISMTDILAISVGQNAMPKIAPTIAKGIQLRHENKPDFPLDIILAENLRDAAGIFADEISKYLPQFIDIQTYLGLIETSIGKMVPIMPQSVVENDLLTVYAEPYNTLILDQKAFKNPIPNVEGLAPKAHMSAWVDRKSFIHNLGHATAAYYGNMKYPELAFMHEIMEKEDVYQTTKATMMQSSDILLKQYPGEFTEESLIDHIDDLLFRFSNKALGDTVFRVGQDLFRKLGPDDRLVGAVKMALKYRMPYDKIVYIIACALEFKATNELGNRSDNDKKFSEEAKLGISHILNSVCGLSLKEFPEIHEMAERINIKY